MKLTSEIMLRHVGLLLFLLYFYLNPGILAAQIPDFREATGFKLGQTKRLATWKEIVDYYQLLDDESDRLKLKMIGQSLEGHPLLMAIVSSQANLKNLALYGNLQKQAYDAARLSDDDITLLQKKSKLIVLIALSSTSRHVASAQTSLSIVHQLVTSSDPAIEEILKQAILLVVPSYNPDALIKTSEWNNGYIDSRFEGSRIAERGHDQAGDDIEFDWLTLQTPETAAVIAEIHTNWHPHIVIELNGLSPFGKRARIETPADTAEVGTDSQNLLQETVESVLGDLKKKGLKGIAAAMLNETALAGTLTFAAMLRNMAGFRIRVADARYAQPLHFPRGSIPSVSSENELNTGAWKQGWWRLHDVTKYQTAILLDLLSQAVANRQEYIGRFARLNRTASQGFPNQAYVLPATQETQANLEKALEILLKQRVLFYRVSQDHGGLRAHDYVVPLAQPAIKQIECLLEKPPQKTNGSPATNLLSQLLDVQVLHVNTDLSLDMMQKVVNVRRPPSYINLAGSEFYIFNQKDNASFTAINRLLAQKKKIFRLTDSLSIDDEIFLPGTFLLRERDMSGSKLLTFTRDLGLRIESTKQRLRGHRVHRLREPKIALYQPWNASADAGWTKSVLQEPEFRLDLIMPADFKSGGLAKKYDAIILTDSPPKVLIQGSGSDDYLYTQLPQSQLDGITTQGLGNLQRFVEDGGTLITFARSCLLPLEYFQLGVEVVATSSGSLEEPALLHLLADVTDPISFGMSSSFSAISTGGPIMRAKASINYTGVPAYFPPGSFTGDGAIGIGENAAVLNIQMGRGRIIMFAIRPQFRGQSRSTFRMLFNAIYLSKSETEFLN